MMRVAVVGLGSIARKAYLPVVTSLPDVTPVLVSRTASSLASVGDTYRVPDRYASLAEAIDAGLDAALVHTTSESHPEVVATLLRAGVEPFRRGAELLGLPPGGLVALEDAPAGIASARAAGVGHVVGVTTSHPAHVLVTAGAGETAADLTMLADAVEGCRHTSPTWKA